MPDPTSRLPRSAPPALTVSAVALLAALTATTPALAATGNPLTGLDGDADGAVTRAEFDAVRRKDFALLDRNRDGKVTRIEFYDRRLPEDLDLVDARKKRYRLLDADRDGTVTLKEYLAAGGAIFSAVDRNRDGKLSGEEIAAAKGPQVASRDASVAPTPPKRTNRETGKTEATESKDAGETREPRARQTAMRRPAAPGSRDLQFRDTDEKALGDLPFAAVDADNDGLVSLKEYDRALLVLFRRLDRNDNKVLSRREYYWRGDDNDKARLAARKRAYRGADGDDDGGLTFQEVRKMTHGLFVRIDRNDDKRLSRAEWVAAFGPQDPPVTNAAARTPGNATPGEPTPAKSAPDTPKTVEAKTTKPVRTTTAAPAPSRDKPAGADTVRVDVRETLDAESRTTRKTEVAARPPASDPAPKTRREPENDKTAAPGRADPARLARIAQAFTALDRDQDRHISSLELAFARMARFTALDANANRVLERDEFVGNRGTAAAKRFAEMDRDGDGLLRWEEYKKAGTARFLQLDANGDKRLSLDEFRNAGRKPAPKRTVRDRSKMAETDAPKRDEVPFEYETPSR